MAAFRPGFHSSLATKFVNDVFYQRNHLFLFVGMVQPYLEYSEQVQIDPCDCQCPECINKNGTLITVQYGDSNNPYRDPDPAYSNEVTIRDNIAYFHSISADDISVVARNHKWVAGTSYTQWDDTKDMTKLGDDHPFYVVNSKLEVFKCLNNNKTITRTKQYEIPASTVEPQGVNYGVTQTSDGYLWKYMYTIPPTKRTKFYNSNWIPVQKSIETTFYNRGAIEIIDVIDQGSGYSSEPKTLAEISPPDQPNGRQAKVSLFVDPDTGSIDGYHIDDCGSGYSKDPTLTVIDLQGSGVGKYGNATAILQPHVVNGCVEDISIIDCGVSYSADTATTIVIQGDGQGCKAYANIIDGAIVGVVITDPGQGYTYADISAVCAKDPFNVHPAKFTCKLGGEILINQQSVVEQTTVQGAIYAIELTDGGMDYTDGVVVNIQGDGQGCQAHCVVENGRIVKVVIDNPGSGYTRAQISFTDENRKEPNPNPKAQAYAILPPIHGHGYDAVHELYGDTIACYVTVRSDNLLSELQQEFRQFGIIENVRTIDTKTISASIESVVTFDINIDPPSSTTGNLKNDSIVQINNTPYRVLSMQGTKFMLQQMSSIYREIKPNDVMIFIDAANGKKYTYTINSIDSVPNIDKYSGTMLYSSNNTPFYMTDNKTLAIRTYIKL